MAQIAYLDMRQTVAHIVVTVGLGVTLCEQRAIIFGPTLPVTRERWPAVRWCQTCTQNYDRG